MARRKKNREIEASTDLDELHEEEGDFQPEVEDLSLGPVENSDECPLFANKYAGTKHAIHVLKIVKLDQPGAGYKGELPKNSTLETISNMFGDGLYNIEAINAQHRVLRVMQNVRISLGTAAASKLAPAPATAPAPLVQTSKEDLDRVERLATRAAAESAEQARQFTSLVTSTVTSAAERERSFMQGVQENAQTFFSNLLTLQTQGFQQVLALMQAGHQQTMEAMRASTTQQNPNDLIQLLISGIRMGREMDEPDEQPFWQELLQGGVQLLGNATAPKVALPPPMDAPKLKTGAEAPSKKKPNKDAQELLKLYRILRSRGIDIRSVTAQLEAGSASANKAQSPSAPSVPMSEQDSESFEDEEEDEEDIDDNDDSEESEDESEGFEDPGDADTRADSN